MSIKKTSARNRKQMFERNPPLQPNVFTKSRLQTPAVLRDLADLFEVRNAQYKDNFRIVGDVMAALQPDGASLKSREDHELYHLYSLIIVKLTRFVASNFAHEDSIKDIGVYSAMIAAILQERSKK